MLANFAVGLKDRQKAAVIRQRLTAVSESSETFSESMLEGLPAPAARYLRHAIAPGTPIANRLEFDFDGHMRSLSNRRRRLSGSGGVITPQHGFLWIERFNALGTPRHGILYYSDNKGGVLWSVAGLVGITAKRGEEDDDTTRAMRMRIMSHLLWTPWAFLPCRGARWEALGEDNAKVFLELDGDQLEMEIKVDDEGRLVEAIHPRWGAKTADGSFEVFPYGILPKGEVTFSGYTVPSPMDLQWCYGMDERKPPLVFNYVLRRAEYL